MADSGRDALVEAGQFVLRDLESRNYKYAGVIAQLARFAATAVPEPGEGVSSCPSCGGPVVWKGVGRPPTYCADSCRRRAHRTKPDEMVS